MRLNPGIVASPRRVRASATSDEHTGEFRGEPGTTVASARVARLATPRRNEPAPVKRRCVVAVVAAAVVVVREGSLLPLWRFHTDRTKRKQVTALAWNPLYSDLFAVGYGSYDFMRQGSGMICCFSLKNTPHPEYIFTTESGVMCLNFHPDHCSLLAVGCYDGVVMVYDVRNKVNRPIYASSIRTGKHTDPVWQVNWQEEDLAKELNFFSISSDGRVANWIMSKVTNTSSSSSSSLS